MDHIGLDSTNSACRAASFKAQLENHPVRVYVSGTPEALGEPVIAVVDDSTANFGFGGQH